MTVGVLLISHGLLGQNMLDLSVKTLSICPLATQALTVPFDSDPDKVTRSAQKMVQELDTGDGVLVLTDLCGATPSNIACRLVKKNHVMVVSGLNLPMLMRVLNYPNLSLKEMADKAMDGGRQGIMLLPGQNEA